MGSPLLSSLPRGTVLVVDDEAVLRSLLARTLEDAGFKAVEAENGEVALRAATACRDGLRLVVTDISMPVMSGVEFPREFRPRWPRTPILFITGKDPDPRAGPIHSLGELLLKPFDTEAFLSTVMRILSREPDVSRFSA